MVSPTSSNVLQYAAQQTCRMRHVRQSSKSPRNLCFRLFRRNNIDHHRQDKWPELNSEITFMRLVINRLTKINAALFLNPMTKKKVSLEELARFTQQEFQAVRKEVGAIREELHEEMKEMKDDLKTSFR